MNIKQISWKIDSTYNKLRKEIYKHAKTMVPRYRWTKKLDLQQAQQEYMQQLNKGLPEKWVSELCDAKIKMHNELGTNWMAEYYIDISKEAQKALAKAWKKVGTTPKWWPKNI